MELTHLAKLMTLLVTSLVSSIRAQTATASPVCELEPTSQGPPGVIEYRCIVTTPADFELVPDNATALTLIFAAEHTVNLTTGGALPAGLGGVRLTSLTVSVGNFPAITSSSDTIKEAELLVPARLFVNLPRLTELQLYSPDLVSVRLSDGLFEGLGALRSLQLSHLGIGNEQLPVDVFRGLERVVIIDLNNNRIRRIARGTFATEWTTNVTSGGNSTTSPIFDILTTRRCCQDLAVLGLARNLISDLSDVSLYGLHNLRTIDLHGNRIRSVDTACFSIVHTLFEINLANNLISRLDNRSFVGLERLRMLFLEHNAIAAINPSTFTGLTRLTNLDVGYNSINVVPPRTFSLATTPRLRELLLQSNGLERIDTGAIDGLIHLRILNVANNQLTTLPIDLLNGLSSPALSISGNPWQCDCTLYMAVHAAVLPAADGATCRTPDELIGTRVTTAFENPSLHCLEIITTTTSMMMMMMMSTMDKSENISKLLDSEASSDIADNNRMSRNHLTIGLVVTATVFVVAIVITLVDCRLRHWGLWNRKRSVDVLAVEAVASDVTTMSRLTEMNQGRRRVTNVRQCSSDALAADVRISYIFSCSRPPRSQWNHLSLGHFNHAASFNDESPLCRAQLSTLRRPEEDRGDHVVPIDNKDQLKREVRSPERTDLYLIGQADLGDGAVKVSTSGRSPSASGDRRAAIDTLPGELGLPRSVETATSPSCKSHTSPMAAAMSTINLVNKLNSVRNPRPNDEVQTGSGNIRLAAMDVPGETSHLGTSRIVHAQSTDHISLSSCSLPPYWTAEHDVLDLNDLPPPYSVVAFR